MSGFIYLASPYSHAEETVRVARFDAVLKAAAHLMAHGYTVFSPIAHSHAIAQHLRADLLMDHDFWMRQDLPILRYASKLVVLTLPGWDASRGVAAEIQAARDDGIPIEYCEPQ